MGHSYYDTELTAQDLNMNKSDALSLNFNRIQFTPDLMPSDILGSEILDENRQFKFIKGINPNKFRKL